MAMVKVCDSCGAAILKGGSRVLHKVAGKETETADLCNDCTIGFTEVFITYQKITKVTVLETTPEAVEEVAVEVVPVAEPAPKKNGKK